ncbi:site-specific DNA-methyltransferase [Clostridium botulinum]|uniref:site-specific DNA-methyltransferase n=1 Tax=Clostridium botulinum TaxID=1491 RepID=UPI003DA27869
MEKMDGYSLNIVKENVEKLKEIFPEVFCEDKVDFERLQEVLGAYVEDKEERYRLEWHGKSKAIRMAQTPSRGTLRPCKEESKNWDTTENLYIEGDNLEVLKLLQKIYQNKIKMIYIDPPYNTGNDFVYKDDYKDNLQNYLEITGQVDKEGNKTSTNSETNGRYHTNWLNMMYPRLRLARNLLDKDGVILIHLDEHEFVNSNKVVEEIFGEENNLGEIVWDKRNPKGDSKGIACQHEYIIIYSKNKEELLKNNNIQRSKKNAKAIVDKANYYWDKYKKNELSFDDINSQFKKWLNQQLDFSGGEKAYCNIDSNGNVYRPVSMAWPNKKQAPDEYFIPLVHPITNKPCPVPARGWRNPPNTMKDLLDKGLILFGEDETVQPNRKYLLKENMFENVPSMIYYGGSDDRLLESIKIPFDTPKVVDIAMELINIFCGNNDFILDFFAGSCTTAHAVMNLNAEDSKNRKFIMVQLPEETDKKSEAYKAGYKNICEIGKERIRRAGDKIVSENKDKDVIRDLDIGFKVFKLDTSNIKPWNPRFEDIAHKLDEMVDNFVPGRTEEDVVYEIMLKYGIDLTYPIEVREISGKKVFSIGFGALVICLDNEITLDVVNDIVDLKNELSPEITRIVFKDNGFKRDSVKTNAIEILKRNNINEVMSI